jgi:hypothetical protein
VALSHPLLLLEMRSLKWPMAELRQNGSNCAPTLGRFEIRNGAESGGFAGIPRPHSGFAEDLFTADSVQGWPISLLGSTPPRFNLIKPERAPSCSCSGLSLAVNASDGGVRGRLELLR